MSDMLEKLLLHRIVAIFRGIEDRHADDAARATLDGGVTVMEVTMNTEGALGIVARWREKFGERASVGAGTVLDVDMAREAAAAGAQFLISPNLDEAVIAYGRERGISVWPGVMTPTEIVRAWKAGADAVKIFPMASLGVKYLAEIRAPLDHIPMIATGGVDVNNIADYFKAGASAVGMGTKLVNLDWVREGAFDRITEHVRKITDKVPTL